MWLFSGKLSLCYLVRTVNKVAFIVYVRQINSNYCIGVPLLISNFCLLQIKVVISDFIGISNSVCTVRHGDRWDRGAILLKVAGLLGCDLDVPTFGIPCGIPDARLCSRQLSSACLLYTSRCV